jgi:hypothetical protein
MNDVIGCEKHANEKISVGGVFLHTVIGNLAGNLFGAVVLCVVAICFGKAGDIPKILLLIFTVNLMVTQLILCIMITIVACIFGAKGLACASGLTTLLSFVLAVLSILTISATVMSVTMLVLSAVSFLGSVFLFLELIKHLKHQSTICA